MTIPRLNSDRLVRTFMDLVRIDTPSLQEAAVADYLESLLRPLGVRYWRDNAGEKIGGNCGNLHVRMAARNSKAPAVLFSAHLDSVMPCIGIKPQLQDGVIRSDGTTVLGADDKAGVAAVVELLRCLHESNMPHGPVEAIFDVSEEIGLLGANHVDLSAVEAKYAFVLDGEELDRIVFRAPSANRMTYEIDGIAAHAGMAPEKGVSAIEVFARAVSNMRLGRLDEESTANIGTVSGGRATNIVADKLTATAEARSHSKNALEAQTQHMSECFEQAVAQFTRSVNGKVIAPKFHADIRREYDAMSVPFDSPVYRLVAEAGTTLGLNMQPMAIGGGTNANVYNEKGLPAVVIGCGMRNEHTTSEHVYVKDLELSTSLCLMIVAKNHELAG
ncbi:M20/M25/M40 family metallo-hydrolase [bacterium]|nr:M20/M25/M40 family metallo-hydrolase [bacterium]MBU1984922.1 M20/M25/M40 family metallo-hydrolase [bacterium]